MNTMKLQYDFQKLSYVYARNKFIFRLFREKKLFTFVDDDVATYNS